MVGCRTGGVAWLEPSQRSSRKESSVPIRSPVPRIPGVVAAASVTYLWDVELGKEGVA